MINTNNFVYWLRICFAALALAGVLLLGSLATPVGAQPIPAGCPGGDLGPPAPGTVCPDANKIPTGCPGGDLGPPLPGTVCPGGSTNSGGQNVPTEGPKLVKNDCNGPNVRAGLPKDDPNHCGILDYLLIFINALSAIVGVVVVISIIAGGIQYSAAGDNPQAAMAAQKRIGNAVLALILYIFAFAFLQWLVPGGLF